MITVLKLYRESLSSGGAHADVFRNEVVIVSYLFSNGSAPKSVYCGERVRESKHGKNDHC